MKHRNVFTGAFFIMVATIGIALSPVFAQSDVHETVEVTGTATSFDGTAISYYEYGGQGPVLVFVHGWSCDASYWREQVAYFARQYHLVLIDLAGHGRSGSDRKKYTMEAFAEDVKAVVESIGAEKVVLIGHSMGALVSAEAVRVMPDKVLGLIAVDDLQNVEYPLGEEQFDEMITPFKDDFKQGVRDFVTGMLLLDDSPVNQWVITDMSSGDPRVAISALTASLVGYLNGTVAKLFDQLDVPVVAVNADLFPTDIAANRRHIKQFELVELPGLDHFLMLKSPNRFNPALDKAVKKVLKVLH